MKNIKDEILEYLNIKRKMHILKNKTPYWPIIFEYTKHLNLTNDWEILYLYKNQTMPELCICGINYKKFYKYHIGYHQYCDYKGCPHAIKDINIKREKTANKNGGMGFARKESKEKACATLFERHGVINPGQLPEHKERMKNNHPMRMPEVIEKRKNNCQEKHNCDWDSQRHDVKDKIQKTNFLKTGRTNQTQAHISDESFKILNDKDLLHPMVQSTSMYEVANELNVCEITVKNYLKRHGLYEEKVNKEETQIINYIKELTIDNIIGRSRKIINNRELDIYLPDYKLAIEYCGLHWHGENFNKNINYHKSKYDECKKLSIRLLTIFNDEWMYQNKKVKDLISYHLNKSAIINAPNCIIKEISNDICDKFLNLYDLHYNPKQHISIGAYLNNTLVSVMTFSEINNYNNKNFTKLLSFCTDGNVYPNLLKNMFDFYVNKNNIDIVTGYSDLRFDNGIEYTNMDFQYAKQINCTYWYFGITKSKYIKLHRSAYNQMKISQENSHIDINLPEREYMLSARYDRIWDCGYKKYVWKRK